MSKKGVKERVYEKLGAFYLGRLHDLEEDATRDDLLLYDSKDLTTHAVCVGMTGSGKTGLCVSLLEEAAIDGIPAIVIDPKGDLGNLLLTFPQLRPADFRPWVDSGAAVRKGVTADEYAKSMAELWRTGLKKWDQDGGRIQRLRAAADFAIYTPGSNAGLPLTVLRSFAAPAAEVMADRDLLRERIATVVSGLLALLGRDADPIQSRDHILISTVFHHAWQEGRDLDLAALIQQIQSPPFEKIGVIDLESFFPGKERVALSMNLNNLLASPSFAGWLEGEPLDVSKLLWTPEGLPRISVLSIAHLSDAERMFFVTILLNEIVGWMRTQSGTSSLRALLYMDEVFGYLPPTANPPSKTPLLTLLKQARAYGLGVILATQNPVDLDYKALSNAGTWMLGRLQTEQDKERVLDGLEGASAASGKLFDRKRLKKTLSALKSRVFLLNNVHEDQPVLFHTRWALSYLRGPLTRTQIETLMAPRKQEVSPSQAVASSAASPGKASPAAISTAKVTRTGTERPLVPQGVPEFFLPRLAAGSPGSRLVYRPALLGTADLHFVHARADVDSWQNVSYLAELGRATSGNIWQKGAQMEDGALQLMEEPGETAEFSPLPAPASRVKSYSTWEKAFKTHLYRQKNIKLWSCPELKLTSRMEESAGDFKIRVREGMREKRDAQMEKLRKRYTPKLARLQDRLNKAEEKIGREQSQYSQQKAQTAISLGATVLGALFGRKTASIGNLGRATTTMRGMGRSARERGDIARARQNHEDLQQKLKDLEADFETAVERLKDDADPEAREIKEILIRPRKADITVGQVALAWTPWWVGADGIAEPAFPARA